MMSFTAYIVDSLGVVEKGFEMGINEHYPQNASRLCFSSIKEYIASFCVCHRRGGRD